MHRFEAYPSKTKIVALLLLTIAMVGMCAFCTTLPEIEAQIAGWAGVLFFGLGFIVFPLALLRAAAPRIVMDDVGIHTGSSIGVVDWGDVTAFRIDSIHGKKFLSVFVQNVAKYLERMPALARRAAQSHPDLGVSEIAVCFVGLTPGLPEACHHLAERGYKIENW
jgi:hypothetical protein